MQLLTKRKCCCAAGTKTSGRRLGSFISWLLPAAMLVLVPKCPLCIMAYVALATGVGISVSTAAGARYAMIVSCIGLLVFMIVRSILRANQRPMN